MTGASPNGMVEMRPVNAALANSAASAAKNGRNRAARSYPVRRAGLICWVPVCLAAGISLWFLTPETVALWRGYMLVVSLAAVTVLVIAMRKQTLWSARYADDLRLGGMVILLIIAGFTTAEFRSTTVAAPVLTWRYYGPIEGRLIKVDRAATDRIRLTLDRVQLTDVMPTETPERVRLSLISTDSNTLPLLGTRVRLTGHLSPPPGPASPGSFDFRWNAWFNRLGAVGYTRHQPEKLSPPAEFRWRIYQFRLALSQSIQTRIGGQEGAVAAALMTGDRSGIAEETNKIMRAANLYHIISISGLHMGMLAVFVYSSLRGGFVAAQLIGIASKFPAHKLAASGAILAAFGYLWLSGGGVATERAFVMAAVMLGAVLVDRRAISLRTVALAASIILILTPEAMTSPGFQMSFAATIALILTYRLWQFVSPRLPFWLRPVAMLTLTSFIAAMATAPFAAAHFNQMVHYGLLANVLVVPVMGSLVMPAGVIGAVLAPIGLAAPALWVIGVGTRWMLIVADFVAGLEGAVTAIPSPPSVVVALFGFGGAVLILCWPGLRQQPACKRATSGFAAGLSALVMSAIIWISADRPLLLIAAQGEAVGMDSDMGRVMSKPAGGSFSVRTWLQEDGDLATQEQSSQRPGWVGDDRDRYAKLPAGWDIWHFTGKGSGKRAFGACKPRRILVATEKIPGRVGGSCLIFDPPKLWSGGAVAIDFDRDGPRIRTVATTHRPPPSYLR